MSVSFISSATSFVQNYGSVILPAAAELVSVVVFKRTACTGKVLFAGFVAGVGVSYFFEKKTSAAIGLTGAVLYLVYKVITTVDFSTQKKNLDASMQAVEERWLALITNFNYDSDKVLDYNNPTFNAQFTAIIKELKPQTDPIRAKWKDEALLVEAREIMSGCQNILFEVHTLLKQQKLCLWSNSAQKMAGLLTDPEHVKEKKVFDSAFTLLNKIYRVVRSKGYMISLINIRNIPEGSPSSFLISGGTVKPTYSNLFFTRTGLHHELNKIFNNTQDRLADLLKLVNPGSPLNAKDEQPFPGDYANGNPNNPFKIRA